MPVTINDLPIEVLEQIADFIVVDSPDLASTPFGGPSLVNPFTRKPFSGKEEASATLNLLSFSQTCRRFRLASLRHLPDLIKDITIDAFGELERIRDDPDPSHRRRLQSVRHISLTFSVPLHISKLRLRKALIVLCCHPSWPDKVFPNLQGISFSSRFLSSYAAYQNTRTDYSDVAREIGLRGWQARIFSGFAQFTTMLTGGQSMMERFGDAEALFLRWDPAKGETWTAGHDMLFRDHIPPPITPISLPGVPLKWLLTIFPPTSLKAPPLVSHPAIHVSHLLVSSVLATPKSSVSTPLRPYAALHERVQHAHLLKEFDDNRRGMLEGPQMFDVQGTMLFATVMLDRICFSIPEPDIIDALEVKRPKTARAARTEAR